MGSWGLFSERRNTYTNTISEEQAREDAEITRKSRKLNMIFLALIVVGFFVYSVFFRPQVITAAMDDNSFGVVTANSETIAFLLSDIESVEFHENLSAFDRGTMQSGADSSSCYSGTYVNDAFGEYQLHANINVDCYVTIHYTNGVLVFNNSTVDNTTELYTNLYNAVNS